MELYRKYTYFPYFIYHLIYLVIQSPKSTANQMMRAADKERRLSFYVGSCEKWQKTYVHTLTHKK